MSFEETPKFFGHEDGSGRENVPANFKTEIQDADTLKLDGDLDAWRSHFNRPEIPKYLAKNVKRVFSVHGDIPHLSNMGTNKAGYDISTDSTNNNPVDFYSSGTEETETAIVTNDSSGDIPSQDSESSESVGSKKPERFGPRDDH
jgi:hypothetical protein